MIIVPVSGDKIKTTDGLPAKVLSFTNLKPEGPAVLVQGAEGSSSSETVFFQDIAKINDQKVKFVRNADGYKVFEIHGVMDRQFQLPQPGDSIRAKTEVGSREFEVKRINLHVKDRLSEGLIFDVFQPGSEDLVEQITLNQITDVDHSIFNRSKFSSYYAEYTNGASV